MVGFCVVQPLIRQPVLVTRFIKILAVAAPKVSALRDVVIVYQKIIYAFDDFCESPRLQVRGGDTGLYFEMESSDAIANSVAFECPRADFPA